MGSSKSNSEKGVEGGSGSTLTQGLASISSLWLALFVLAPTLSCLLQSLHNEQGRWSLQSYLQICKPPYFKALANSLILALSAGLLALVFAYPLAIFLKRRIARSGLFWPWICAYPFLGNAFLRLYSFKYFLGSGGPGGWLLSWLYWPGLYSKSAVVLGLTTTLFPLAAIPITLSLLEIPENQLEAAKDLGASTFQVFRYLILPLTWSAAQQALMMVVMPSLGLFYVSETLGGGKHPLLGNLVKEQVLSMKNFPLACATNTLLFLTFQLAWQLWKLGQPSKLKHLGGGHACSKPSL